jgi:AmmeMemoRadiSam system protein A
LGAYEGALAEKRGCFVTLTNQGALRGCIGTFAARRPLAEAVVTMAAQAAKDPRFIYYRPVTAAELDELSIEVSVLSPLEPIEDPLTLKIGTHGIYIDRGGASGCFLPEVATDQGWNAEQFLSHCCSGKAGLPADAWRQADTQVYVFTSEKFD